MHILSVNIGRATPIRTARSSRLTGIYKLPVDGPARVTSLGLASDAVCDAKHHGGVDQAVYVFGEPDYAWWSNELGRDLPPGTFGENLTISGLESAGWAVGDRLHMDEVVLEVTAPRIPCGTLTARMGDRQFVKRFRRAERPGLYCRVIREGEVRAGEMVRREPYGGAIITVAEMFRDYYDPDWDEARLRRYLAAPIAIRDREDRSRELATLLGESAAL